MEGVSLDATNSSFDETPVIADSFSPTPSLLHIPPLLLPFQTHIKMRTSILAIAAVAGLVSAAPVKEPSIAEMKRSIVSIVS